MDRSAPAEPAAVNAAAVPSGRPGRVRRARPLRRPRRAGGGADPGVGTATVAIQDRRRLATRWTSATRRRAGCGDRGGVPNRAAGGVARQLDGTTRSPVGWDHLSGFSALAW